MSSVAAECVVVFLLAAFTLLVTQDRPAVAAFFAEFEKARAEVDVVESEAFVLVTISFSMLFMACRNAWEKQGQNKNNT
jgi:hypothetical protein